MRLNFQQPIISLCPMRYETHPWFLGNHRVGFNLKTRRVFSVRAGANEAYYRVGKTTTAEAVALHTRKPLFTITSGDLGFTPADVEKALQETFRLAQIWDCVLLLDEADLFLSRREVEDMERNALVSGELHIWNRL